MGSIYDDYSTLTAETDDAQKQKRKLKVDPVSGRLKVETELPLEVDENGNLRVTGAGAAPSATRLKIADGIDVDILATVTADGELLVRSPDFTLTSRMFEKRPADGFQLWMDLKDADFMYLIESPIGTLSTETGFRGVRVPLDSGGAIVGAIEINDGPTLTFENRKTDEGWQ